MKPARSILVFGLLSAGCPGSPAPVGREARPPAPVARGGVAPARASAAAPGAGAPRSMGDRPAPRAQTPLELHRSALVIDAHCDAPLRMVGEVGFDYGKRQSRRHTDLVRMKEGGLDAEFLAVWVQPRRFRGARAWRQARRIFDAIHRTIRQYPSRAKLALTAADVRATVGAGKIALLIGVEGAHSIGRFDDRKVVLERVRWMYRRGARYITLTWMNSNPLAGSSGDVGRSRGLSPLGHEVVKLMNDLGMMVDVSHVSDATFRDVIKASRLPVIASHSNARALAGHYRNITDDMLRALTKNRGVVWTLL